MSNNVIYPLVACHQLKGRTEQPLARPLLFLGRAA
jgi:hypothetical protein